MPVYLTFDIGTTAMKTALVVDDGVMLAVHTTEYSFMTPSPGWVEMEPEAYWRAAIEGTREVLSRSKVTPADIAAIGFSSQGQTFVPIDTSGKPLYNAIVWLDERAVEITREWEADWLSTALFQQMAGYPQISPMLTGFKIAWLARYQPDAYKAWKFLTLPDYLIYRMTGELATDFTMAQTTGLYNIGLQQWNPQMITAAGITTDQLPSVLKSGDVAGKLSNAAAQALGLCAGVPVCVGANDQLCGALGAGNTREGIATETTGTALAVVATTNQLIRDSGFIVGRHPMGDAHFAMPYTNTSGIVLKWLRDLCAEGSSYESFLANIEQIPVGSDGITMLPYFCGTASPDFNSEARGAFVGLTLGHTKVHLARAVMESCCCVLQDLLDGVVKHGVSIDVVRCLGGGARSDVWLQMKSDMLGTRVERPACTDAASVGAAILAAVGTGQCDCLQSASSSWYRTDKVFEPNGSRTAAYQEVYRRHIDIRKRLYE